MAETLVEDVINAIPSILSFPISEFSVDYDQEADVLYISSQRPQKATDTEVIGNGILMRYRNDELVGVTVMEASRRAKSS